MVLGVQFSRLEKLTAGHFGQFWNVLGTNWGNPSDCAPLEDQFEDFDQPRWKARFQHSIVFSGVPFPGRFMVENASNDRMIQVQPTRFHYNWRRREDVYPSYQILITEFEKQLNKFFQFSQDCSLGEIAANQWELTYVNAFPVGVYWNTPADWARFLPGLFSNLFPTDGLNIELENRAAEWTYEIKPKLGRLHISARTGKWGPSSDTMLLLQTTARGPIGKNGAESLRQGLDMGHSAAVGAFESVVDQSFLSKWGIKS